VIDEAFCRGAHFMGSPDAPRGEIDFNLIIFFTVAYDAALIQPLAIVISGLCCCKSLIVNIWRGG
jgi:hypothetical protein